MLFNTLSYFWFVCLVFSLYWFVFRKSFKAQNYLLFASSYCFYGWWDIRFLILIFISSSVDYFLGRAIFHQTETIKRKLLLGLCIVLNIGILGFFKYYNFFIESFSALIAELGLNWQLKTLKIILPVGISFYTFQSLSYSIDVYRRNIRPTNDFISFMTFVSFFPQLVAGPIERASNLLPQFLKERQFQTEKIISGFRFILYGLFKKMVIADRLGYFVDQIYSNPTSHDGITLIAATFMFGIQIYCDFSGYSDIAIGSARLLGFDLLQNFRTPYLAKSIQDFWRRWHISLSTWFRDYIYIPIGGNQVSQMRWIFNVLLTFTISGLWHGASATFVIWGFLHGLYLVIEKFVRLPRIISGLNLLTTFIVVNLTWVFFRAESISQSMEIISGFSNLNMDFIDQFKVQWNQSNQFREFAVSLFAGLPVFLLTDYLIGQNDFNSVVVKQQIITRWAIYFLFAIMILLFGVLNSAPQFIYFQF